MVTQHPSHKGEPWKIRELKQILAFSWSCQHHLAKSLKSDRPNVAWEDDDISPFEILITQSCESWVGVRNLNIACGTLVRMTRLIFINNKNEGKSGWKGRNEIEYLPTRSWCWGNENHHVLYILKHGWGCQMRCRILWVEFTSCRVHSIRLFESETRVPCLVTLQITPLWGTFCLLVSHQG